MGFERAEEIWVGGVDRNLRSLRLRLKSTSLVPGNHNQTTSCLPSKRMPSINAEELKQPPELFALAFGALLLLLRTATQLDRLADSVSGSLPSLLRPFAKATLFPAKAALFVPKEADKLLSRLFVRAPEERSIPPEHPEVDSGYSSQASPQVAVRPVTPLHEHLEELERRENQLVSL